MRPLILAVVAVLAGAVSASAQTAPDPRAVMPERPSVATHAGTVAPGMLEIESGVELDRYDDASRAGLVPATIKIGLAPRLQLTVATALVHPSNEGTGLGDTSVGIKWRISEDAPLVGRFAVLPSIKFPSGTDTTGTGTVDGGLLLISSHQLGGVSLDLNAGITRRSGDGSNAPRNATLWAVAAGGPVHGSLGWGAELYGYPATSGPTGQDAIVAVLVGPTLQVRNTLVLDVGLIAPISGPQPRAFFAGVTYNAGSFKR